MLPRDNIRKTFTVMHYPVLEHKDTLSFAFLVCIILYIDGKQFRCIVFTFVQYICSRRLMQMTFSGASFFAVGSNVYILVYEGYLVD